MDLFKFSKFRLFFKLPT